MMLLLQWKVSLSMERVGTRWALRSFQTQTRKPFWDFVKYDKILKRKGRFCERVKGEPVQHSPKHIKNDLEGLG